MILTTVVCLALTGGCVASTTPAPATNNKTGQSLPQGSLSKIFATSVAGLTESSVYPAATLKGPCAKPLYTALEAVSLGGKGDGVAVIFADVESAREAGEAVRTCRTEYQYTSESSMTVDDNGLTRQVYRIAGKRYAVGQYRNIVLDFEYSEPYDVGQLNQEFPPRADSVG